jgi:hypothetical protein
MSADRMPAAAGPRVGEGGGRAPPPGGIAMSVNPAGPVGGGPVERAADFTSSIGVNIHPIEPGYDSAAVIQDAAYLGVSNLRTQAIGPDTLPGVVAAYEAMASAGLRFDFITGGPPDQTVLDLAAFEATYPGAVAAIEGPNEVNNFPFTYDGLSGTPAAIAYQRALYNDVRANPALAAIPILNFTDNPPTAGAATAANQHVYPVGGDQPLGSLTAAYKGMQKLLPGKPVYFTEAGYYTLPGRLQWVGVDDETQAKLTLNLLMDAASLGVAATYLYDLVDDGPDPGNDIQANHFGLFNLDGTAKPSAVAIHDLTTILADPGARAATFRTTPLNVVITGLPSDGHSLVLEKSSGVYDIVLWAEPDIWNPVTNQPIAVAPKPVTVRLLAGSAELTLFDPLNSANPVNVRQGAGLTVNLTDHPLIIQVSNFVAAMAALPFAAGPAETPGPSPRVAPVRLATPHAPQA